MAALLLTATREVSEALAPKLEAMGHQAVIAPLLEVRYLACEPLDFTPNAILITSRYALKAAVNYPETPLYIVGKETTKLAEQLDYHVVQTYESASTIELSELPANTLYLRGQHISRDLPFPSQICYAAEPTKLPELPAHDAVLVLSARTATLLPQTDKPLFCLSERIADTLPKSMHSQTIIASHPTEEALLASIKDWSESCKSL